LADQMCDIFLHGLAEAPPYRTIPERKRATLLRQQPKQRAHRQKRQR
jgi:hypothetical protein